MGILSAMNSAVGGLGAQSFALENISGNIANSSTTGFKRKDTSFADLVRSNTSNPARVASGSVIASSRSTITLDGDVQGDKVDTHLALNGTGFFTVSADPLDNTIGARYTRAGDFEQYYDSRNGQTYLRNGSGYSLVGINLTPAVGEDPKGPITIDKTSQSAKASKQITYKLNLPTEPVTTYSAANKTVSGANVYNPNWPAGSAAPTSYTISQTGKVVGNQVTEFMNNSISGGTVTVYDAQGTPAVMQLRWAKFDEAPNGGTPAIPATSATVTGGSALPADLSSLNGKSFTVSYDGVTTKTITIGPSEFTAASSQSTFISSIQAKLNAAPTPATGATVTSDAALPPDGSAAALNAATFNVTFDGVTKAITMGTFTAPNNNRNDVLSAIQAKLDAASPTGFGPGVMTASVDGSGLLSITSTATGSSHSIGISGMNAAAFFGTSNAGTGLDAAGGFGPGVMNASVDGSGRLVVSAANAGVHTVAVSGAGVANFFGAPTAVAGTNAVAAVPPNPDAGRSEWGLFYRNLETYDSADSTDAVWTQISSNTSVTNGKLGRTAVTDGMHAAGSAGWTPTYTNTNPTGFFFDKNGKQLDATSAIAINNLTVGGKNFGTITLDMGATEFADKNGLATANQLTQDGYSTGAFEGLSIDNNSGIVSYNYSNGQTVQKWKIPIVAFNGASYLKAEDGGAYTETIKSGSPIDINGSLSSSALEASNVDISEEFTKLIVTQQAFSANSKVITTADQMMQSILQIIR